MTREEMIANIKRYWHEDGTPAAWPDWETYKNNFPVICILLEELAAKRNELENIIDGL